jgi:tetratricopeptide (TPR) repeat protein
MFKNRKIILIGLAGIALLSIGLYQIPGIQSRLAWRYEVATTYLRGIIHPAGPVPTALPITPEGELSTATPANTAQPETPDPEITPTPTPEPLPAQVFLPAPDWEQEDMNNCGPATLSMAMHAYGWDGDQYDISDVVKPVRADRNVNPDELAYYVRNYAGWLRIATRVNGNLSLLKRLLAAGYPVIIEKTFTFDSPYWPNDDLWAAHYALVTGYDDTTRQVTIQDAFHGPDQVIPYQQLDDEWRPFNYVYLVLYLPDEESELRMLLGPDWDVDTNRQNALLASQKATTSRPNDAYSWFNLGTNLLYFERYGEAAQAYDTARNIGLPQRMMRYQFGPFIAYFQANRIDDLLTLTNYALQRTDMSEEAWLWHGWALYRQDDVNGAIANWRKALSIRPDYPDALYALGFVGSQP